MTPYHEHETTSNSTVYRRRHKEVYAGCSYCPWHGVENASRQPAHGENKPRDRRRRIKALKKV